MKELIAQHALNNQLHAALRTRLYATGQIYSSAGLKLARQMNHKEKNKQKPRLIARECGDQSAIVRDEQDDHAADVVAAPPVQRLAKSGVRGVQERGVGESYYVLFLMLLPLLLLHINTTTHILVLILT